MVKMKSVIALAVAALLIISAATILAQDDGETVLVSGQEVRVLPLSAVTASEPHILDVTDTSARVNFVGTVPLACYLVYGPDENFGAVTNDPNMTQAAIIEHNPVLLGLEPDTEYVFRMQGTGEDGTLYVSELYKFRTAAASDQPGDNLLAPANGAVIVEVSSNFGGQPNDGRWGILNAFDGNPATEWSSDGDGNDAYFVVALDGTHQVDTLVYWTRAMADGSAITQSFTVTIDNGETFGPFELPNADQAYVFEVDFVTSTLRFEVETSTGGNTGAKEVAAYGSPVAP
jgi:hypothetical protein